MNIQGRLKTRELNGYICDFIVNNGLKSGDPILSEVKLAETFGLSRVTVRRALADLTGKNILYKVKGKGTFVSHPEKIENSSERSRSGKNLVLILSDISNSYFAEIAKGVEEVAKERQFRVYFNCTDNSPEAEERLIKSHIEEGVSGMIIGPAESVPTSDFLKKICFANKNIVIVNEILSGIDATMVSSDDREGARMAIRHLIDLGHRRIAHIRGPIHTASAVERFNGYKEAFAECGMTYDDILVKGGLTYGEDEGYCCMKEILRSSKSPGVTAVFAASDMLAWGVCRAVKEAGLEIPGDISVVGYGDVRESIKAGIPLTSVNQNSRGIGRIAADVLIRRLQGDSLMAGINRKILLRPELVTRDSTSAPSKHG